MNPYPYICFNISSEDDNNNRDINPNNSLYEELEYFINHKNLFNQSLPKSENISIINNEEKKTNNIEDSKKGTTLKEEIPTINIYNNNNFPISNNENIKSDKKESTTLGRKTRNSDSKVHDKYSSDNIIRKIKSTLISNLISFINNKIYSVYKGKIGQGALKKELKPPEIQTKNLKENKELLYEKLKDIFSKDISGRYTNYCNNHNKKLINILLNKKMKKKNIRSKIYLI